MILGTKSYGFIALLMVISTVLLYTILSMVNKQGEGAINAASLLSLSNIIPSLCQKSPANDWFQNFKPNEASAQQIIDYFYWTNRSSCVLAHDFGGVLVNTWIDGQKSICLDQKVAPKPKNCIIYSFGINNEWSFDDLMEKYGCKVFAFDPSMDVGDHKRSDMISFYKMGLDDHDHVDPTKNWKLRTLKTIYKDLGHEGKIIDYLKIDIENGEWKVLAEILKSGMMSKVRQLGVEFHWFYFNTIEEYRSTAALLKSIEDSGLIRFDSKYNPGSVKLIPVLNNYDGPSCFEIAWYQVLPF